MGGERRVLALRRADIGGSPEYREADVAVKGQVIEIGPRGGKIVGWRFENGKRVGIYGDDTPGSGPTLGNKTRDDAWARGWSFPSASGWSVNRQASGHSYEIQHRRPSGEDPTVVAYEATHVGPDNQRTHLGQFPKMDDAKRAAFRHDVERRKGGDAGGPAPAAKLSAQTAERSGGESPKAGTVAGDDKVKAAQDALDEHTRTVNWRKGTGAYGANPEQHHADQQKTDRLRQALDAARAAGLAEGGAKVVSLAERRQPAGDTEAMRRDDAAHAAQQARGPFHPAGREPFAVGQDVETISGPGSVIAHGKKGKVWNLDHSTGLVQVRMENGASLPLKPENLKRSGENIETPPVRPDTTERHQGAKYQSGRDTAEIARLFREDVKQAIASGELPKGLKLAVKTHKYSGGSSIRVEVQAAPGVQIGNPDRHAYDAQHGPYGRPGETPPKLLHADGEALKAKITGMLRAYEKSAADSASDLYNTNFHPSVEFAEGARQEPLKQIEARLRAEAQERSKKWEAPQSPFGREAWDATHPPPSPAAAKLEGQTAERAEAKPAPPRPPAKPGISQTLARQIAERRPALELGGQQTDLAGPPSRKTYVSAEIQRAADDIEKRIGAHEKLSAKTGEWSSREALNRYINEAKRGIVELRGLMRRAESEGAHGGNLGTRLLTLQTNLRHAEQHLEDARYRTAKPASDSLPLFRGEPKPNRVKPPGGQGDLFGKSGGSNPRQGSLF